MQEKRLNDFLQLSTRQRQAFLARHAEEEGEEEKQSESEEEDKRMEEEEGESESQDSQSDDFSQHRRPGMLRVGEKPPEEDARVDQVFYFMSQALIFGRIQNWETTKMNLITCALCVVAATRNQPQASTIRMRMMEDNGDGNEDV